MLLNALPANELLLLLMRRLEEGFYQLMQEEELRPTPLITGDRIVFYQEEGVFLIIRNDVAAMSNAIRLLNGDSRFYLATHKTEDFLIVARFIGLLYFLRVEMIEENESRVFARFV